MYTTGILATQRYTGWFCDDWGLQVTVWGDYGRIEGKKVFMGVAQIMLDDLDLSKLVMGWYKLFGTTSLVSVHPSFGLSRRGSVDSLWLDRLNKL